MKRTNATVPAFQVLESAVVSAVRLDSVTWADVVKDYEVIAPYIRKTSQNKTAAKSTVVRRKHSMTLRDQLSFRVPYRSRVGEPLELARDRRLSVILAKVPGAEESEVFIPLFPSYTSLLGRILDGRVTLDMLRRGLFCFGCTEGHVKDLIGTYKLPLNGARSGSTNERTNLRVPPQIQALVQSVIIGATVIAEEEGRILWRGLHEWMEYEKVNDLLQENGFVPLKSRYESYSYNGLREFVDQSGQYLRVIW